LFIYCWDKDSLQISRLFLCISSKASCLKYKNKALHPETLHTATALDATTASSPTIFCPENKNNAMTLNQSKQQPFFLLLPSLLHCRVASQQLLCDLLSPIARSSSTHVLLPRFPQLQVALVLGPESRGRLPSLRGSPAILLGLGHDVCPVLY
jgi:hypothetical protein